MQFRPFTGDYEQIGPIYGMAAAELRERDHYRGVLRRWITLDSDGDPRAAAELVERPDGRQFLALRGDNPWLRAGLAIAARGEVEVPVHITVNESDRDLLDALRAGGFQPEMVSERFLVRFVDVLARFRRVRPPHNMGLYPADRVDRDRLFELDTELRNDVPGTDGWRGNREWFDDELAEAPPFDPSGYWVAIDNRHDRFVGLCRMWRNQDGPRLGLIGVARPYRQTTVAAALLRQTLDESSHWGWDSFSTEASTTNRHTYPRLARLAAERLGRSVQLVARTGVHSRQRC